MSQVNVIINGRQFRMACENGQESHLQQLARDLDQRIEKLRKNFGEIGDTRLTVMAALTVADELAEAGGKLAEAGGKLRKLEEELASSQAACAERAVATQAAVVAALNSAAERIELVTRALSLTRSASTALG